MPDSDLLSLLQAVQAGELDATAAADRITELHHSPEVENLGFARIDHDRARRRGFPEVIFGAGKTPQQVVEIFGRLATRNPNVLCTRATPATAEAVLAAVEGVHYHEDCGVLRLWRERETKGLGKIVVVCAGTSDLPVAREATLCAEALGNEVESLTDVGVAGLHRLLAVVEQLREARVVICVAGMEAALPSVVAGLVDRPVVAVPTSVGYGATFDGLTALLSCLTSCAAGVSTVNIDNGFGAAYAASLMNRA
jgi:NCAIR mutase (PurE)-related protein